MLGITGKLALWQALRLALGDDPRLEGIDLAQLDRAREGAAADASRACAGRPPSRR